MTAKDILPLRLAVQHLLQPQFSTPGEVVARMGAVQAQDYFGALWSIGQRLTGSVREPLVEKAVADKTMVRTWPMRGTLHFVSPKDIRWMLKYLTPRVLARMAGMLKQEGIDTKVLTKSKKILVKAMEGGKQLTREEVYAALENARIPTSNTRGLHIVACLAQDGVICFGPRRGKQQTFVLLDEWLPSSPIPAKDEALAELARRYFSSHGPATLEDFAWWSGLTKTESVAAIGAVKHEFGETSVGEKKYLMPPVATPKLRGHTAWLLPAYDEFGIAYKDRTAMVDPANYRALNGFMTVIAINGKAAGAWKRTLSRDAVLIAARAYTTFDKTQRSAINMAAAEFGRFLNVKATVEFG